MITKSTYEMHRKIGPIALIANACYFAHLPVAPPAAFGEISPVSRRIGKGSNGSTPGPPITDRQRDSRRRYVFELTILTAVALQKM